MAVDQEGGSWEQAWMHRQCFAGVEFHKHEALPTGAVAMGFRLDPVEKGLLELEDVFDMHAGNKGLGRRNRGIGEDDIFELVGAPRKDRSPFVDLCGIEEIKDGEVLNLKYFVHTFEAKASFPVQEV